MLPPFFSRVRYLHESNECLLKLERMEREEKLNVNFAESRFKFRQNTGKNLICKYTAIGSVTVNFNPGTKLADNLMNLIANFWLIECIDDF